MTKLKLPLGKDDFKNLRESQRYYVDKSLLIEEVVEDANDVIILPRPRRFGKTLSLSMLRYFFDCVPEAGADANSYAALFEGLSITQTPTWTAHQGKYPVLLLNLKDCKAPTWERMQKELANAIWRMCVPHKYLLHAGKGTWEETEKNDFQAVLEKRAPLEVIEQSILLLSTLLERYHEKKVIVLIDEYDSPLIHAYQRGYYEPIRDTLRQLLSQGLKSNKALSKGVITGILRVAKESIFSGLNNPTTATVLSHKYSNQFGFTPQELKDMLAYYKMEGHYAGIEQWYNGYLFGGQQIYNPWSILAYLDNPADGLKPYWVNTSENSLTTEQLERASDDTIQKLEMLVQGQAVETPLYEHVVFSELHQNPSTPTLFSFLVFSGYLKATLAGQRRRTQYYRVQIPNEEVLYTYEMVFGQYLEKTLDLTTTEEMLQSLLAGEVPLFTRWLQKYVITAFSHHDVGSPVPEKVYHGFMLGVLAFLFPTHQISSNRETGLGRADMLIIPRDAADERGYVLEFKQAPSHEALETTAQEALAQVAEKDYTTQLRDHGKTEHHHLGIAFWGKELAVRQAILQ